jgi:hypothetical protein
MQFSLDFFSQHVVAPYLSGAAADDVLLLPTAAASATA